MNISLAITLIVAIPTLVGLEVLVIKEWDKIRHPIRSFKRYRRQREINRETAIALETMSDPSRRSGTEYGRNAATEHYVSKVAKLLDGHDLHV